MSASHAAWRRKALDHCCGCYFLLPTTPDTTDFRPVRSHLPLQHLEIHSTILSTTCRTTFKQTFVNNSDENLEEIAYSFPIYAGVSVVSFTAAVGDVKVIGLVKEKQQARQEYKEAVDRGEEAGLLEQLPDSDDILNAKIGNVPARGSVVVELVHVSELKYDAQVNGVRLTIPNCIAPRYGDVRQDILHGQPLAGDAAKGIDITVDVQVSKGSMIEQVQSPSHPISVDLGRTSVSLVKEGLAPHLASASLSLETTTLEKEFTLLVKARDTQIPRAWLETHPTIPKQRALMATLVPNFKLPPSHGEIVFVLDRSGSMGGKMHLTISAMKIILKSLPIGVKFNICSFGSNHEFMWEKSLSYSQETLDEAFQYLETQVKPNMGGTEIMKPLEAAVERKFKDIDLSVIMLTDGEVWNTVELFKKVNGFSQSGTTRFFTLGIGSSASTALVEGIAEAGQGISQFVTDGEKMEKKMSHLLKGALSASLRDFSVELKYAADKGDDDGKDDFEIIESVDDASFIHTSLPVREAKVDSTAVPEEKPKISMFDADAGDEEDDHPEAPKPLTALPDLPEIETPAIIQAPHKIPPMFPNSRTTVYFLLGPGTHRDIAPKSVVFRGKSTHGPLEFEIEVQDVGKGETIHQLAAKKASVELEREKGWVSEAKDKADGSLLRAKYDSKYSDILRREAVALGVRFQVGGKWCSFLAVREGDEAQAPKTKPPPPSIFSGVMNKRLPPGTLPTDRFAMSNGSLPRPRMASAVFHTSGGGALFGSAQTSTRYDDTRSMGGPPTGGSFGSMQLRDGRDPFMRQALIKQKQLQEEQLQGQPQPQRPRQRFVQPSPFNQDPSAFQIQQQQQPTQLDEELRGAANRGKSPEERMHELIGFQRFDGSWEWSQALLETLGAVVAGSDTAHVEQNAVSATCMAIAFLQNKVADLEDVWELVVEKAEGWLNSQVQGATSKEMVEKIKARFFS